MQLNNYGFCSQRPNRVSWPVPELRNFFDITGGSTSVFQQSVGFTFSINISVSSFSLVEDCLQKVAGFAPEAGVLKVRKCQQTRLLSISLGCTLFFAYCFWLDFFHLVANQQLLNCKLLCSQILRLFWLCSDSVSLATPKIGSQYSHVWFINFIFLQKSWLHCSTKVEISNVLFLEDGLIEKLRVVFVAMESWWSRKANEVLKKRLISVLTFLFLRKHWPYFMFEDLNQQPFKLGQNAKQQKWIFSPEPTHFESRCRKKSINVDATRFPNSHLRLTCGLISSARVAVRMR